MIEPRAFNLGPLDYLPWLLVPFGILVVIAVVVVWRVIRLSRGGKSTGPVIPSHGIEIIEGRPGAGKSFFGVGELVRIVRDERLPVYTNLPLRWRVARAWARITGGIELARLIIPLDKEHFERFLSRAACRTAFSDNLKAQRAADERSCEEFERRGEHSAALALRRRIVERFSPEAIEAAFVAANGESVFFGVGANDLYRTSRLILDEVHQWYPMEAQKSTDESWTNLRNYLRTHRHHLHRILVITQERMQVAKCFRDLAQYYWTVRNRGDDKLAWGIRFKHLGVKAIAYCQYTPEQEAARSLEEQTPSRQFTVFHWSPWERWKFRLYDSWTHAGGKRGLLRSMEMARAQVGLNADGRLEVERQQVAERAAQLRRERSGVHRMRKWSRRIVFVGGVGAAFGVGMGFRPPQRVTAPSGYPSADAVAQAKDATPITWDKFEGLGKSYARFAGKRLAVGDRLANGATVGEVDIRSRSVLLHHRGDVWVWKYGSDGPTRMGTVAKVRDAVAARIARKRDGERKQTQGSDSPFVVGPSGGDAVRREPAGGDGADGRNESTGP